ncbi:hypothetical protein B7453_04985 [Pseudomonas sp. IB20]|uniref:hypothetical protein n=1 Tax=Pseudomonas TaxID=286 RepID=UPI000BA03EC0|nr:MULTISPECIES: hypothetical protein [unclassified Pseudomonas]MCV2229826.1 hypothetical protein [Pseudomonas sp. AU10]OZO05641.1 hypothetical protein B7453_04985 [Pseudomonas sp. IB20]
MRNAATKDYNFSFRTGTTTGYRNVIYESLNANSEAAALEKMKQKYNDSRDVISCTFSGEAEENKRKAEIEEQLKTETDPQKKIYLQVKLEQLQRN